MQTLKKTNHLCMLVSLNMLRAVERNSVEASPSDESDAPAAGSLCISSRHALPIQIPHFRMRDAACRESDIKWQNFIVLDVFVFDIGSHFAAILFQISDCVCRHKLTATILRKIVVAL
jgi:hypothetical protein